MYFVKTVVNIVARNEGLKCLEKRCEGVPSTVDAQPTARPLHSYPEMAPTGLFEYLRNPFTAPPACP